MVDKKKSMISCEESRWLSFVKDLKSNLKTPYSIYLARDMPWNTEGTCVLCLHLCSLKNAYWCPRHLYARIEYSGKICVWLGEELPAYFCSKINWVAMGCPTSCLISNLKGSWFVRADNLFPSFALLNSFSMSAQAPSVSFVIKRWHLKEIWQYLILTHKACSEYL